MLKIGEFARKNNVTVRALHHYEEIGLLEPAKIDRFTGYRYYDESQDRDLIIINMLKSLGFSLSEIATLMKLSVEKERLIIRLNEKYTQARIDLDRAQFRSLGIENLMEVVQKLPDGKKVNIKEINDMVLFDGKMAIDHGKGFDWGFDEILEECLKSGRNITTMVLDIDRFKGINDKYGRKIGDAVLDAIFRGVVNVLPGGEGIIRGYKSNLERIGGDEFIIRVDMNKDESLALAERIRKSIHDMDFSYLGITEDITVTLGVAYMDSNPKNAEEFTHLAQSALYLAKHNGRNRVEVFTEDLNEKLNSIPE
ncbi:MAG: diguanylate cyclase [Clostridia bacterium]|nr:diguanylate cyclase [Clostridia bacterium]